MDEFNTPLVSVCVLTYNHEKYIEQSIESIISQVTNFPIEIVIGEDCSTDDTPSILLELKRKYPQIIRLILSQKNQGINRNLIQTIQQAKGKYFALLAGDDYFVSPYKLQKQVEFLENHPECVICFHAIEVYIQETREIRGVYPAYEIPIITTIEDLIKDNYLPAAAVMCRNVPVEKMHESFYELMVEDWPNYITYAKRGKIGYIKDIMAHYRVHSAGIFSKLSFREKLEHALAAREFVYDFISNIPKKELGIVIINNCFQIANLYCDQEDIRAARKFLNKSLSYFPYFLYFQNKLYVIKVFLRVFFPILFAFLFSINQKFRRMN